MPDTTRHALLRYLVALAAIVAVLILKMQLDPLIFPQQLMICLLAVLFVAWYGGLGPGFLATVLGVVSCVPFSASPVRLGWIKDPVGSYQLIVFVLEGGAISILMGALHVDRYRSQAKDRELRVSESWCRRLLETAYEGIWTIDAEARTTYANRRMAELLGYTSQEMLGRPVYDFIDAKARADSEASLVLSPSEPAQEHDLHLRHRNGTDLSARIATRQIHDEEGRYLGALAMVSDVTLEDPLDGDLEAEREFMEAVQETAACLVIVLDRMGQIVRFNRTSEESTGYTLREVRGRVFWDLLLPLKEAVGARETITRLLAGKPAPHQFETTCLTRDGRLRRIAWNNRTLLDSQGEVEYVIATGIDVTERRQAEEALRTSEERYALTVRGTSDGLWDWNILTNETYLSPRFKELIGYDGDDNSDPSASFESRLHPEDHDRVLKALRDHIERQVPYDVEFRLHTEGGDYRWFHSRGQAIWDETGKATRMAGSLRDITDRKQAEEALRLTQFSVNHSLDAIFWLDPSAQILNANDATCLTLGYARDEVLSMTMHDIDPSISAESWPSQWARIKEQGSVFIESVHRTRDGRAIPVEVTFCYLEFCGQEYACSFARDITERKRAEETLRASEARLQAILDNSTMVVHLKDLQGRYLLINRRFETLFQVAREQVIGKTVHDMFPPETAQALQANDQAVLKATSPLELEEMIPRDGEMRTYISIKFPILDATGNPYAICGISTDITLRKRAEKALRASEERYRLLFERNLAGVLRSKEDGRILDCNDSAARILGYGSREEVLGRTAWDFFVATSDREGLLGRLREQPVLTNYEMNLKRKDGTPVCVLGNLIRLGVETGHSEFQMTIVDITERKQAEQALRKSFKQVRASRKRLKALSRRLVEVQESERRAIARELHDEIGHVLTGLKFSLEMAARLPADKRAPSLEESQALVNRLMAQLRDLSLDLRPTMLDDLGLKPALLWHFEHYTAQTGIRVVFEHSGLDRRFLPEVETAAYRIVQEALTNVARHARVSEVTMRLWANDETLGLQVEDQGVGFDPAAARSASRSSGLSGMNERASLVNGQLTIESAPGDGTTLIAEFPVRCRGKKRNKASCTRKAS